MISEILCVGTELLLGDIVNTNAAYIARELAVLGFTSYRQSVVGDNPDRLRSAIRESLSRADIVVMTGGLGPTYDDITKTAAAEIFGKKMIFSEEVKAEIEEYFNKIGRVMTENNLAQAYIPEGAIVLHNKWGTAPGVAISGEIDGKTRHVILLPGPPSECEPMFEECVKPYLAALSDKVIYSRNLHLYGIGESAAENVLREIMEASDNPSVAPYACEHEVRIRITAMSDNIESAKQMCSAKIEEIKKTDAWKYIFTETDNPTDARQATVHALIRELRSRKLVIGTAESCTAGMIASEIGDIPGASDVFEGGIVSYANEVKMNVLGVPSAVLEAHGAVSEECASHMARGALRVLGTDIAVSVTGIAGPGGGTEEKPVGTVCFGVAMSDGRVHTETMHFNPRYTRMKIRRRTAAHAMMLAIRMMRGEL